MKQYKISKKNILILAVIYFLTASIVFLNIIDYIKYNNYNIIVFVSLYFIIPLYLFTYLSEAKTKIK